MSQTRLCRDSSRESERNGSVYTKAKGGQINLVKGFMHKDAKSLSLKYASTSLSSENFGSSRPDVSSQKYKSEEKLVATMKKKVSSSSSSLSSSTSSSSSSTPGSTLTEKSVHEKINFSLHLPMSNSSHSSTDTSDTAHQTDNESLKLTESGFLDDADDKDKMADKKSKGKRKKNVTKKTICSSLQLNNNNDDPNEDVNGNPVNSNQSQSYNHPDVAQIDSLQKEMGKELAYKQAPKPTDSKETPGSKKPKGQRKEARYILAEDIPDYRGRDKIEDILKFIGKNPSNETLNKSLERKKKSKRKGLNGHVLRSGIGNMDTKSELSDSESTNLCPTMSPSFLDKDFCNCDTSEIDSCLDDDSCVADESFVSNPGNTAPSSAEPFILVEKKNKKKIYPNSSSSSNSSNANNPRPNKYLSSKSPFRNRKLNSAMAHPHHAHHQFDYDSKTELDSSFPDLESSYHKMRRNSTGNVIMSMSTVQSITLEDSDNESWKSLPISQGAHLINEKSYPVSYAKIAASSLPSNPNTGNSSIISANDDGGGGDSCSGGSSTSDGAIEEKNVDEEDTNAKDGILDAKVGYAQSDMDKRKYLLRSNYDSCSNACVNRRHSIGQLVGTPEAAIKSVVDTKQEISRSQHLLSVEDGGCSSDMNPDCQISFGDHKSVTSVDELVISKFSQKESSSPSSSIETLTPNTVSAEAKTPSDSQLVSSTPAAQRGQSCDSSSSCSSSGMGDDALAVKFVNPRDRRHNDKQFKITFGFFCDMNNPQGNTGSEEDTTRSDISLPSIPPPPSPPVFAPTSPKLLEMFAVPPIQQDFENSKDRSRDVVASATKESADGQPSASGSQSSSDFVTGGSSSSSSSSRDINKATTAIATTASSSSLSSSSSSASVGAICDLFRKEAKPVDVDMRLANNKLNGLVLSFVDKTCLTPSSSVTPASEQAVIATTTTTTAIISTTTTSTTKKSITSPAMTKTIGTAVSSNSISGAACGSHQLEKLACRNSVTDASTDTSVNSNCTNSNNNNTNASAAIDNAAETTVHEEFGLIPLSYGNKIKSDNKKVIHFRSDEADAQLFNQEEVLSYLSKEYHRVCQLSGPSTIVRVGTE